MAEVKMKKGNREILILIALGVFFITIAILLAIESEKNCEEIETVDCSNVFLGVCFDSESLYYKCDIIKQECNVITWERVSVIKYLQENDIKIYGTKRCIWCERQIEEFGQFKEYVSENLFIDCDITPTRCKNVESTPTWKQGDKVIHVGYKPLSEII